MDMKIAKLGTFLITVEERVEIGQNGWQSSIQDVE